MAFSYQLLPTTEVGKQVMNAMCGGDFDFNNFSLKEYILSKYGSFERLKQKAKSSQDWQAQADLAHIFQYGVQELNIEIDFESAIGWYETSIQNGNSLPGSKVNLATLYDVQDTVFHQLKAHQLYLEASRLGSVSAELNLAESYRCGVEGVVNEDLEEAFKWYRRAAGEEPCDDDDKDTSPGSSLIKGSLRKLDLDAKLAALKRLHQYYMCGDCPEGEPQPVKALYYLKKAAELGDPEAQKELGLAYLTGDCGHLKDLHKAKRWLTKAAQNGQQDAQKALKTFDEEGTIDIEQPERTQSDVLKTVQQMEDLNKIQMKQEDMHPQLIQNPTIFQESIFTQFPDSPTAQHYLKAFQLVKKGLDKLKSSGFTDPEGIKLIAQGILYESSITQSFEDVMRTNYFIPLLFAFISMQLKSNPTCFEGLLIIIMFHSFEKRHSLESCKVDLRKTMSLNNLILLIKKAEPDRLPKENPYNFEEDYSSWLHVLYYFLGSLYSISQCYKSGADAFQEALNCCPNYFEAKGGLARCLMNMAANMKMQNLFNPDEELLQSFEPPKNQRVPKGDYLTWTEDQLIQKAKQLFLEYLEEAPECDKKYSDYHYHLAVLYSFEGNLQETIKWKEKGEDSEEKRLPFMEPVNVVSKNQLALLDVLSFPRKA